MQINKLNTKAKVPLQNHSQSLMEIQMLSCFTIHQKLTVAKILHCRYQLGLKRLLIRTEELLSVLNKRHNGGISKEYAAKHHYTITGKIKSHLYMQRGLNEYIF